MFPLSLIFSLFSIKKLLVAVVAILAVGWYFFGSKVLSLFQVAEEIKEEVEKESFCTSGCAL